MAVLGVTVIASFSLMWSPYLSSVDELLKVRRRSLNPLGSSGLCIQGSLAVG